MWDKSVSTLAAAVLKPKFVALKTIAKSNEHDPAPFVPAEQVHIGIPENIPG